MKKLLLILGIFSFTFFLSQKNENYLPISYGSICCGTPSTEPVMNYLAQFQKKNKLKIFEVFKQSGLGREGEFRLYIGIDHLSKTKKANFVKGLRSAIEFQNKARMENRDGSVSFDDQMVRKANLLSMKNLTIYKNKGND